MDNTVEFNIYFFLIVFIILFIAIYIIYCNNLNKILKNKSKRNKKEYEIMEVNYLTVRKNIDKSKLLNKKHMIIIATLDSIIIATVSTVINFVNLHILWQLSIGFVLLFLLIYAIYDIYGNILISKGYEKKEEKKIKKTTKRKKDK